MKIKALGDSILFEFLDGASTDGMFATKLSKSIVVLRDDMDKQAIPRWGRVLAIGSEVGSEIVIGKYILIDSLKWTVGLPIGEGKKIWKTTYEHVSAVSDEEVYNF